MIQLATDPNARRPNWQPAPAEGKDSPLAVRPARSGHAWPFISRHGERSTSSQETKRPQSSATGS